MAKQSIQQNAHTGFKGMKPDTRKFFVSNLSKIGGAIDKDKAAAFFGVTPRTIANWWRTGAPNWVDNYVHYYERSIPDTKEWRGYYFARDGRLMSPYRGLSFSANELSHMDMERMFASATRRENQQIRKQLDSLRDEDEVKAIKAEFDKIVKTLEALKHSPALAVKGKYIKPVSKRA
ncbi:hypothetical protein G3R49_19765 [Shewanella sp. WXL01]|uniref:DUF3653 domain-containing protein n=1 Tax=Shewanella sp. WXL01 TaxID=2709721 RepID=UPI001438516D|nr:DUF3653 domain-containing protein [Shewanella sp. WXL01]NKF52798.1 hypothetical protein [Shewanella sp. WXL01]